jgi:hypothetical protein
MNKAILVNEKEYQELFMPANRKKLIVIIFLYFGILLCILGCVGMKKALDNSDNPPIRRLRITIDESRREELFAQLQEFADKHAFEFHLTFYDRDNKIFLVELVREDLEILAADVPKAPTKIDLRFLDRNSAYPTPEGTVDELVSDLKSFINEIPNVTVTEQP